MRLGAVHDSLSVWTAFGGLSGIEDLLRLRRQWWNPTVRWVDNDRCSPIGRELSPQIGPGFATDVTATFMYTYAFTRGQIGLGSASSMMMLMAVVAIIVPYLYSELRGKPRG